MALSRLVGAVASMACVIHLVPAASAPFLPHIGAEKGGASPGNESCQLYSCADSCGRCFNAGAREGVRCRGAGQQTGYYCPAEMEQAGHGDVTFACMDWTFGSASLRRAEQAFLDRTGEDVSLGVGTYGTADDPQGGLGACYRLRVEGVDKDIIAQSINTGHDVAGNQFDLQMGGGGVGAFNNCAGADGSMFPGEKDPWGCQYGGVDSREACADLPPYPRDEQAMRTANETLISLCEHSWDMGVRLSGQGLPAGVCQYNPTLLDVARVLCPEELVELTWMQRVDEPEGYRAHNSSTRATAFQEEGDRVCRTQTPGMGSQYCLTRMMDCRKPSGAFKDNIRPELMVPGRRLVQTCTADGYTRIDVQCGCEGCYC